MYPGLAYMERIAEKSDVIPLEKPQTLKDGSTTSKIVVSTGQVSILHANPAPDIVADRCTGHYYPDHIHPAARSRLGERGNIFP